MIQSKLGYGRRVSVLAKMDNGVVTNTQRKTTHHPTKVSVSFDVIYLLSFCFCFLVVFCSRVYGCLCSCARVRVFVCACPCACACVRVRAGVRVVACVHVCVPVPGCTMCSVFMHFFVQRRRQHTQRQLIKIYSVDWTDVYDTHNIEHGTEPVCH